MHYSDWNTEDESVEPAETEFVVEQEDNQGKQLSMIPWPA
jgi:hypothetical protein